MFKFQLHEVNFLQIVECDHLTVIFNLGKGRDLEEGDLAMLMHGDVVLFQGQVISVTELADGVGSPIVQISAVSVSSGHSRGE